jgi:hemerythrin
LFPRAAFVLRKKLKRGLKNHLDSLAQAFRIAEDHAETEEEFEITFEYAQYQMRKHINDTIAEKHENRRSKRKNATFKNKNQELLDEMEALTKKRNSLLYIVDKVTEYSLEI